MEFVKIPLTPDMKKDYAECQALFSDGEEKDCGPGHEPAAQSSDARASISGTSRKGIGERDGYR